MSITRSQRGKVIPLSEVPATLHTVGAKTSSFAKQRLFHLHVRPREYRQRLEAIDAVATLPGGLFLTLTPLVADDAVSESSRLSIVPKSFAKAAQSFIRRVQRAGATFALRLCSRAGSGVWWPHAHGIIYGLSPARLERFAQRSGLTIHLEVVQNPEGAGKYILSSKQAKHYDRSPGRTFWTNVSATKRSKGVAA